MDGWMDEWMDGRMDEWMDGHVVGRSNRPITNEHLCFLITAQKALTLFKENQKSENDEMLRYQEQAENVTLELQAAQEIKETMQKEVSLDLSKIIPVIILCSQVEKKAMQMEEKEAEFTELSQKMEEQKMQLQTLQSSLKEAIVSEIDIYRRSLSIGQLMLAYITTKNKIVSLLVSTVARI